MRASLACQPSTSYAVLPQVRRSACRIGRSPRGHALVTRATETDYLGKFKAPRYLEEAAKRYQLGLDSGFDEDDLVALEFGVNKKSECSELQLRYFDAVKGKLEKRAEEMRREEEELKERLARNLKLGQRAYERGEYPTSVQLLERAVEDCGENSQLGGEAQLWLALAYQACAREQDAINKCKYVEDNHPSRKIKKQAENLRYILEAPKLQLNPDEKVTIPLLQSDTWRKDGRRVASSVRKPAAKAKREETYWDRATWDVPPADFIPDKWYIRVAWCVLLVGTTIYANTVLAK